MTNNIKEVTMYETEDGQVFKSEEEASNSIKLDEMREWYMHHNILLSGEYAGEFAPKFEDLAKWLKLYQDRVEALLQLSF